MIWTTRRRSDFAGLSAIDVGRGPLVLLLHGVGLRAEAFAHQIDALRPHHRVVAVDLPGHGQSPPPSDHMGVSEYAEAIITGLTEPALVVGHSMGAMIALDLATRHSNCVQGVVALNAIYKRSPTAAKAVQERADSLNGVTVANPSTTLNRWFAEGASPERDACHDWLTSVDPAGYRMAYDAFAKSDGPSREALAELDRPALFMTGSKEPNSTPEMSRTMAALSPKGRAVTVQNAAHMMPMTHAHNVNSALTEFAREVWR